MTDLQSLVPFVEVVKCNSFSAAAIELGITPPAISKSIARLESQLGVRLLNRTTRKLQLTAEGREFFNAIRPMIAGLGSAIENIKGANCEPKGLVRITVAAAFGRYCVVPALAQFFRQYPDVAVEMDFQESPRDLIEGGFDVGIRHGHGTQTSYVTRPLPVEYAVILVASPEYLVEHGEPRSLKELNRHGCLSASAAAKGSAAWKLARVNNAPAPGQEPILEFFPVPKGRLTFGSRYDVGLTAALNHIGIAPLPLPVALPHLKSGQLKEVLPEYQVKNTSIIDNQLFIQYPHRQYLAPRVKLLVEYLLNAFSSTSALMGLMGLITDKKDFTGHWE